MILKGFVERYSFKFRALKTIDFSDPRGGVNPNGPSAGPNFYFFSVLLFLFSISFLFIIKVLYFNNIQSFTHNNQNNHRIQIFAIDDKFFILLF